MSLKHKALIAVLVIVTIVAAASAIYSWFRPQSVIQGVIATVKTPEKVIQIQKVEVLIEKIQVIEKEKVIKEVNLPSEVADDPSKQVTAVGDIQPYKGVTRVTCVTDTDTGETVLYQERLRRKFFELMSEKELGVRYGAGTQGMETNVFGQWTFFRAGSLHLAAYGEATSRETAKAMLEVSYRWR